MYFLCKHVNCNIWITCIHILWIYIYSINYISTLNVSNTSRYTDETKSKKKKKKRRITHTHAGSFFLSRCIGCSHCLGTSESSFFSLWSRTHTSDSARSFQAVSSHWDCIIGLSFKPSSFLIWAAAGFSGSPTCRRSLQDCPASDHVNPSNKSSLIIMYTFYWLCSSRETWLIRGFTNSFPSIPLFLLFWFPLLIPGNIHFSVTPTQRCSLLLQQPNTERNLNTHVRGRDKKVDCILLKN
jgi:hypothetical protein